MYLSDIHTHSIASGHGTNCTISDMAKEAGRKGLKLLGISDHGPGTLASGTSSYFRSLPFCPRKRFNVDILYGVELNILNADGQIDLSDELLNNLDYAIISMHRQNYKSADNPPFHHLTSQLSCIILSVFFAADVSIPKLPIKAIGLT